MFNGLLKCMQSIINQSLVEKSAGGVIILYSGGEPKVLMVRNYNRYVFPKGHIEPGETPEQTALREIREETGFTDLKIIQPLGVIRRRPSATSQSYTHKDIYMFLTELGSMENNQLGDERWDWLSFQQATELVKYEEDHKFLQQIEYLFWQI